MCLTYLLLYEYKMLNTISLLFLTHTSKSIFLFINYITVTTKMFVKFEAVTETL